MKRLLKIFVSIMLLIVLIFAGGLLYLTNGLNEGQNLRIDGLRNLTLNDGVYNGQYKSGRWSNKLNITVENKKITNIDIIDDVTFAKPEVSDELFGRVINEQCTDVDVVSGATVTSKSYLKSIENAFANN